MVLLLLLKDVEDAGPAELVTARCQRAKKTVSVRGVRMNSEGKNRTSDRFLRDPSVLHADRAGKLILVDVLTLKLSNGRHDGSLEERLEDESREKTAPSVN